MNQETANYIMQRMSKYLDNSQMIKLKDTLDESLRQSGDGFLEKSSQELLDMFIATKRLEDENYIFKSPLRRIRIFDTTKPWKAHHALFFCRFLNIYSA